MPIITEFGVQDTAFVMLFHAKFQVYSFVAGV